jgi:chorismate synthase
MAGNTYGKLFTLTSFGESHGIAVGGVIDGCPSGVEIDEVFVQAELNRRRPGQSDITTPRDEKDKVEFLSGIFEGKSTGAPIAFMIKNADQKSGDYDNMKNVFRPSHADYTYEKKYGIRDHRGGGRSSARETIARVVGGAVAKLALKKYDIKITAYTSSVGDVWLEKDYTEGDFSEIEKNIVRCPDREVATQMIELIKEVKNEGDTIGGVITGVIQGAPIGLGEPVYDRLEAELGKGMLSINAVKGFEFGSGFAGTMMRGSEHNDAFISEDGKVSTKKNYSGGIQGGISNGQDIYFDVAFKPVATILQKQNTVDKEGKETILEAKGRHDPCVLPRAVPIVEAMAAMTILDAILLS